MAQQYRIGLVGRFESAHNLRLYKGACERIHGHTWGVEISVDTGYDPDRGYGIDFADLRAKLEELTARLDHQYINEIPPFDKIEPTSEHIAKWFHEEMTGVVTTSGGTIHTVKIWEGPLHWAEYRER